MIFFFFFFLIVDLRWFVKKIVLEFMHQCSEVRFNICCVWNIVVVTPIIIYHFNKLWQLGDKHVMTVYYNMLWSMYNKNGI